MKVVYKKWFVIILLLFIAGNVAVYMARNMLMLHNEQVRNITIMDSLNVLSNNLAKSEFEKHYLSKLINLGLNENDKEITKKTLVYEINDEERKFPKNLASIIKSGKRKLIVRYTEIGCNACADSTFRQIKMNKFLASQYETIILVDFTNYEYYLKWKKIAEINDRILWLQKGELPFEIEKENVSYLFTVGEDLKVSDLFIPNSLHTNYLKKFFTSLNYKIKDI